MISEHRHQPRQRLLLRLRASLLATAAAAASAASSTALDVASRSCQNPLFEVHWAGKSDIRHLEASPIVHSDLLLCPVYNSRPSCCSRSFEAALDKVFQRWVEHFKRRSKNIKDFMLDMTRVKVSQLYSKADQAQQQLFSKALASFAPVMDTHFTCFDTLLEYVAGMLCFSCDPEWNTKVLMDTDGLLIQHVLVNERSNEALWASCRALGAAAAEMHTRIADSALVKTIGTQFEDLTMFVSKIGVSEYMATLGLLVMRGPNEHALVLQQGGAPSPPAAPKGGAPSPPAAPKDTSRRLTASPASLGSAGSAGSSVDPVHDGRMSGFRCTVFPRQPLAMSGCRVSMSWPGVVSAVSICIFCCWDTFRPLRWTSRSD